jgi:PST family polysaccharide transporter
MLWYGGTITVNGLVTYVAYNLDKVLVGRVWGADALGIYGRAYQLMTIPNENLNYTMGLVAFPALARVQGDEARLRDYFVKGYRLLALLSIPIAAACMLLADDIVRVLLGPRWSEAATVLRVLAPTILVFGLINPLAWLLMATGQATKSLKIAFLILPVVIVGYLLGLSSGPVGVAAGLSIAMLLLSVPVVMWSTHGTPVSGRDIGRAIIRPLVSAAAGALVTLAAGSVTERVEIPLLRLGLETIVLFAAYGALLWWVLGQKAEIVRLVRDTTENARRGRGGA